MTDNDVFFSILSVVVMTAILIGNLLIRNKSSNAFTNYLWTEHRALMNVSMVFIAILLAFGLSDIAVHFGWLPASAKDMLVPVLGIPMALLSVAVVVIGVRALIKVLRPAR